MIVEVFCSITFIMTSRLLAIRKGKTGDIQQFSKVKTRSDQVESRLLETFRSTISDRSRTQILFDTTLVTQVAVVYDGSVGFLTRPIIVEPPNDEPVVVGSFSNTIGQVYPMSIPLETYMGYFTSLVPAGEATLYSLPTHPTSPDTIGPHQARPRRNAPDPEEPTLARLNFPMAEGAGEADRPVIAALPVALPIPPGVHIPHTTPIDSAAELELNCPWITMWMKALKYLRDSNDGISVTRGGPLFDQDGLLVDDNPPEQLDHIHVVMSTVTNPTLVPPTSPFFALVNDAVSELSNDAWMSLGDRLPTDQVNNPAPNGHPNGWTPEQFTAALEPVVNKEKKFHFAARTGAKYRLLLASSPPTGEESTGHVSLPTLLPPFLAFLSEPKNATAAEDLKELVRCALLIASRSDLSHNRDVSWSIRNVTLALGDRVRTFAWLTEGLVGVDKSYAQDNLNMMHFLPPRSGSTLSASQGDAQAKNITMANSSDSKAQLEATAKSKLYSHGRLSSSRDIYECVLNLRLFLGVMVEDIKPSLLVSKLVEYADVIMSRDGKRFFETYAGTHTLLVNVWQDIQLILLRFLEVASNIELYTAVQEGNPVSFSNYEGAILVADDCINRLKTTLLGHGLGRLADTPCCMDWFPGPRSPSGTAPPTDGSSAPKKARISDDEEAERRKSLGILDMDRTVLGTNRFPLTFPVYHQQRGMKSPERVCAHFMTRGFHCKSAKCKHPHISNPDLLSNEERKKLVDYVEKYNGLSWVPGKAPAGTE